MRILKATAAVCVSMVVIDLIWLGMVAEDLYNDQLGPLKAQPVIIPAAALFYIQYVAVIVGFAVLPARRIKDAAIRGLGIGWVAYATYELTNWAVIQGWPASLVPIDIAWGLALTTLVATFGRLAAGPPHSDLETGQAEHAPT
jgi:uncharacterized membrane protein